MTFSGTHVRTVRTGSYPLRMGEYADEEEIEFFSDSEARKAKLSAFSPWQKIAFYTQETSRWWAPAIVQYTEGSVLSWRNVPVLYDMNITSEFNQWTDVKRMIVSGMPCFPCCKVLFRDKFVNARRY